MSKFVKTSDQKDQADVSSSHIEGYHRKINRFSPSFPKSKKEEYHGPYRLGLEKLTQKPEFRFTLQFNFDGRMLMVSPRKGEKSKRLIFFISPFT